MHRLDAAGHVDNLRMDKVSRAESAARSQCLPYYRPPFQTHDVQFHLIIERHDTTSEGFPVRQ